MSDDNDWDVLNRLRKERHEEDGTLSSYFEIPKRVTEGQLRKLKDELKKGGYEANLAEYQTVPKQAVHVIENDEETTPKRIVC